MTVDQLPMDIAVFARYLGELTERLDREAGWYGVFWRRDPEGLAACLRGAEIPPWDVVESLLLDLGAGQAESENASALHNAAVTAHDLRAGGHDALRERLELMHRERAAAAARGQELLRRLALLAEGSPGHQALAHELSWVNDDHARAAARCAELSARLAALPVDDPGSGGSESRPAGPDRQPVPESAGSSFHPGGDRNEQPGPDPTQPAAAPPASPAPGGERRRRGWSGPKRRSRGARYAPPGGADPVPGEPLADAVPPLPMAGTRPRGARFGSGGGRDDEREKAPAGPATGQPDVQARRAAAETVAVLSRLRAEGRGGEAHAVLCEAATRPAAWLPVLGDELHRSGLGADWATLLWEAASLPPAHLAAAAQALGAAGRADDCRYLLRQGVARPPAEIAEAVLALDDAGGEEEANSLLSAFVRARAPEDAAQLAASDPRGLVPRLLTAARAVSPDRERDLVHALRVAGLLGA
ncbi:hypothetical protein ABZ532_15215 [Streptomyces sp. NPDC019396]|uniref:hypothetical protein n=1 Tax=Streptomyces sp. NPDC019396 TaxID=3154687 RepID=UPI0034106884